MIEALRTLGVGIDEVPGDGEFGPDLLITPGRAARRSSIDCGLAGTVMRFLPPVAALALGPVGFDGDAVRAQARPCAPRSTPCAPSASTSATTAAARCRSPCTAPARSRAASSRSTPPPRASSCRVCCSRRPGSRDGLVLRHTGERLPSLPHIEMTIACLAAPRRRASRSPEPGVWVVAPQADRGRSTSRSSPTCRTPAPFLGAALARRRHGDDRRLAVADHAGRRRAPAHPARSSAPR